MNEWIGRGMNEGIVDGWMVRWLEVALIKGLISRYVYMVGKETTGSVISDVFLFTSSDESIT